MGLLDYHFYVGLLVSICERRRWRVAGLEYFARHGWQETLYGVHITVPCQILYIGLTRAESSSLSRTAFLWCPESFLSCCHIAY